MALATFKDLCIDTVDVRRSAEFWGTLLGLTVVERGDSPYLVGETPEQTVWLNLVPEPRTVKNRVHLDVFTPSLAELYELGATFIAEFPRWVVLADPEGQEFCAFVREAVPAYRLKDVVVDSPDPERIARWWHGVFGGEVFSHPDNPWWWLDGVPGAPFESIDFVEVPEPKLAKNRVHWDVWADSVEAVLGAGATLVRAKGGELGWHVLADPDGNEFCVFDDTAR